MWTLKPVQKSLNRFIEKATPFASTPPLEQRLATPLSLLSLFSSGAFAPLARWAHRHPVASVDLAATKALQKKITPLLRSSALAVSTLDDHAFLNIIALPTGLILWKNQRPLEGVLLVVATLGSNALRFCTQHLVNRPRPDPALVWVDKKSKRSSFPSGHTLASTVYWGWIIALQALLVKKEHPWKWATLGGPALLIALTGPSRVYLGAHWTSDVVGGYLLGGSWLALTLRLYLWLQAKKLLVLQK